MPYAEEVGLSARTFQLDSWVQIRSTQSNSALDRPYSGISTRVSVCGSASVRSSDLVTATPASALNADAFNESEDSRRSAVDREADCSRCSRSAWLSCALPADRLTRAPSTGES